MLDPARVRFVLVGTQSSGNVGAAARAIKNFGFRRLDLVAPECDPLDDAARRMAVEARDVLESAAVHPTLDGALAGAAVALGTSRRTGKHRRPHLRLDAAAPDLVRLARDAGLACVFGREDHGLSDAQLDLCTHLVHLPTAAALPSLNLAQAVLLVAYELRRADATVRVESGVEPPAGHGAREAMYAHLEQALRAIGFLGRDTDDVLMRRLRRALGRAGLTAEEVTMLRGVARQTLWAARRAGLDASGPEGPAGGG